MATRKSMLLSTIDGLRQILHDDRTLFNWLDNAGQTLWIEYMPTHAEAMEKLEDLTQWDEPAMAQAVKAFGSFSSRITSFGASKPSERISGDVVHQFLSLEHYLQPESEGQVKLAIEQAMSHLSLPSPLPADKLKEKLPHLLESVTKMLSKQNKKGGWIG